MPIPEHIAHALAAAPAEVFMKALQEGMLGPEDILQVQKLWGDLQRQEWARRDVERDAQHAHAAAIAEENAYIRQMADVWWVQAELREIEPRYAKAKADFLALAAHMQTVRSAARAESRHISRAVVDMAAAASTPEQVAIAHQASQQADEREASFDVLEDKYAAAKREMFELAADMTLLRHRAGQAA